MFDDLFYSTKDMITFILNNPLYMSLLLIYTSYSGYKDYEKYIIPQKVSLAFFILRLAIFFIYPISLDSILGCLIPFFLFWVIAAFLNVNMGGDIKFMGVVGIWLGLKLTLFTTSITCLIILLYILVNKFLLKKDTKVAYGLFFLISLILILLYMR